MSVPALPEIELSAAWYLETALQALSAGDVPRVIGCLASIDSASWFAITARFPGLPKVFADLYRGSGEPS